MLVLSAQPKNVLIEVTYQHAWRGKQMLGWGLYDLAVGLEMALASCCVDASTEACRYGRALLLPSLSMHAGGISTARVVMDVMLLGALCSFHPELWGVGLRRMCEHEHSQRMFVVIGGGSPLLSLSFSC